MTFFKIPSTSSSKKNKTASAANTPLQTPRTSIHLTDADIAAVNKSNALTPEALNTYFQKTSMGHMQALSVARMCADMASTYGYESLTHARKSATNPSYNRVPE
ncbi:hypothetical protein FBU30_000836 [Linnemannia zychae]|nr:hypothetical protein FBU30_000836 [Linnemannia zychae]